MFRKINVLFILLALAATCFAVDSNSTDSGLPGKETSEYWVIRCQALTELTPFLTHARAEAKGHYDALAHYIKYIEKGKDFLASDIEAVPNPAEYAKAIGKSEEFVEKNIELPEKPMTLEQLVEFAMEFVLEEGYAPTDVNGPEELKLIKDICRRKVVYVKKIRNELRKVAQECMDMKAYLESIDQFEACVKYSRYQKVEKEKAEKERRRKSRGERAAKKRARIESQKQNEWSERQDRIRNRYYDRGRNYNYRNRRYHYNRW